MNSSDGRLTGFVKIGSATLDTTGVLGVSANPNGEIVERGFPRFVTLPAYRDLSLGAALAFLFRLVVRCKSPRLLRWRNRQRTSAPRSSSEPRAIAAARLSGKISSIICGSNFRAARRRAITIRCRNSPILA